MSTLIGYPQSLKGLVNWVLTNHQSKFNRIVHKIALNPIEYQTFTLIEIGSYEHVEMTLSHERFLVRIKRFANQKKEATIKN